MVFVTMLALTKVVTVQLYLDAMEMIPSRPRTLVSIGHDLFGKGAMYFIAGVIAFNYLGLNMCYLIVLGKTLASWTTDVFGVGEDSILTSKSFYIIVINLIQGYWYYKRQLRELKIVSQGLFLSFLAFIAIICLLATVYDNPTNQSSSLSSTNPQFKDVSYSFEAIINAYGFMALIFSLSESLRYRTRAYMAKSVATGLGLVTVLYIMISVSSIFLFGQALVDEKANLMNNINVMYKNDPSASVFAVSSLLRFLFSTILFFHVPFVFFLAKDAVLLALGQMLKSSSQTVKGSLIENHDDYTNAVAGENQQDTNFYGDISFKAYFVTTTIIVLTQLVGACTIDFINKIVPWTSIISTNCIEFLFPSLFYLVALRRYHHHQ